MNLLKKNVHGPFSDVNVACDGSMFIVFLSRPAIQKVDVTHIFAQWANHWVQAYKNSMNYQTYYLWI